MRAYNQDKKICPIITTLFGYILEKNLNGDYSLVVYSPIITCPEITYPSGQRVC